MFVSLSNVEVSRHLSVTLQQKVRALAEHAAAYDGVAPLDEENLLALNTPVSHRRHLFMTEDDDLLGYVQATRVKDTCQVAVVVSPQARRRGIATEMLRRVRQDAPLWPTGPDDTVDSSSAVAISGWAHGKLPSAQALATSMGATATRELLKMQRPALPLPAPSTSDDITLVAFDPAQDLNDVLRVNAEAFKDHPEQGSWQQSDVEARMAEPWFDAAGFFLAKDSETSELLGFHWTKTTTDATGKAHGEVYVVGVAPHAQGRSVGRVLLETGLLHLQQRDAEPISLYVESDNAPAVGLYENLLFNRVESHVVFTQPAPEHPMTGAIPIVRPTAI